MIVPMQIAAPDFFRTIAQTFSSSHVVGGEAKLQLSEDVVLTLKSTGKDDRTIVLQGRIELHFLHGLSSKYGMASNATKKDRSERQFIIFFGNGGIISVSGVSSDGVMRVERYRPADAPIIKQVRQPIKT